MNDPAHHQPETPDDLQPAEAPPLELTVIIPVRNEAESLSGCLASLLAQSEPGFALGVQWELVIVDDESTDATPSIAAEAAATHPAVRVLAAPPLDLGPYGGFTGKNNACWTGAQASTGNWLLFTDADTLHEPGDLSRSLREADRHHAKLLSYSPRQIVTGFWQRAVMPLVFSELASVYPPHQVNDPKHRHAAANGQFLLVERDTYFSVGGHRAIGPLVLEDVALARNIKRGPRVIRFRYAPEALSTRMYRTTSAMIEGWTKNLALLLPSPLWLAFFRLLDLALILGIPLAWLLVPPHIPYQDVVFLLIFIRTIFRFYNRVMRAHFSALDTALSLLGIPLFVYLLFRSAKHHRINKKVEWKGRRYKTEV